MIYFINNNKDPYFNLAVEEYLITNFKIIDKILLLWQNNNTIVIGRNQNTIEEINNEYVQKNKINVIRRLSGGGAVFQDLGNLNFSFIFHKNKKNLFNYKYFTQPIINILQKLGLNAEFNGKNDILINNRKISGNAQYIYKNKILHHGTILFNVDMTILSKILKPDLNKLKSKSIKSIESRVANISSFLNPIIKIKKFKNLIINDFIKTKNIKIRKFSKKMINDIELLANQKYKTWDWNYGKSPEFTLQNKTFFVNKGTIHVLLNIKNGIIKNIKIYGDFLSSSDNIIILEKKLINQKYNSSIIYNIIKNINIKIIFGNNFSINEIVKSIIK